MNHHPKPGLEPERTPVPPPPPPPPPRRCPACYDGEAGPGKYLCFDCWGELPLPARRALKRQDVRAVARLRQLHRQLGKGVPLARIVVTP